MNDLGRRVSNRVLRGGSFNNNASNVRSANRNNNQPDNRNNNNGFRVGSTLPCRNSLVVLFRQFTSGACQGAKSIAVPCRAAVRLTDGRPFGQMQNRSGGSGRPQGSNAPPDHLLPYPASIGIARRIETCGVECHRCDQIDVAPRTFSGCARECRNRVDLTNLAATGRLVPQRSQFGCA